MGFLDAWHEVFGSDPVKCGKVKNEISRSSYGGPSINHSAVPAELADALDAGSGSFTRRLGRALAKREDTRYGEEEIHVCRGPKQRGSNTWKVVKGV